MIQQVRGGLGNPNKGGFILGATTRRSCLFQAAVEGFHARLQAEKLYHPRPRETFSKPHWIKSNVQGDVNLKTSLLLRPPKAGDTFFSTDGKKELKTPRFGERVRRLFIS